VRGICLFWVGEKKRQIYKKVRVCSSGYEEASGEIKQPG
jgi:hypothetical protein